MNFKQHRINFMGPCPCESSGLIFQKCCLKLNRFIRKNIPSLSPAEPKTNYSHQGCYLSHTNDCSYSISGEHFVSKNILEEIGDVILVGGMRQFIGEDKALPISALKANILCERHNNSLSPLDIEAGNFYKKIKKAEAELRMQNGKVTDVSIISGELIEKWMLKLMCGLYFSNIAHVDGVVMKESLDFDISKIYASIVGNELPPKGGLYINATGQRATIDRNIAVTPMYDNEQHSVVGLKMIMSGIDFELYTKIKTETVFNPGLVFRPSEIVFQNSRKRRAICLTWSEFKRERGIKIEAENLSNSETSTVML